MIAAGVFLKWPVMVFVLLPTWFLFPTRLTHLLPLSSCFMFFIQPLTLCTFQDAGDSRGGRLHIEIISRSFLVFSPRRKFSLMCLHNGEFSSLSLFLLQIICSSYTLQGRPVYQKPFRSNISSMLSGNHLDHAVHLFDCWHKYWHGWTISSVNFIACIIA